MAGGSVFESFAILFTSNAEDVEKGAKEATKSGNKLEKQMKDVDKTTVKAGESFRDMANRAASALLPLLSIAGLGGLMSGFATQAATAGKTAQSLRMDIEHLQQWQGAVEQTGGTMDGFNASIGSLNGKLDELRRTGSGPAAQALARMGISARGANGGLKETGDLLLDLSDKFAGMNGVRVRQYAEMLGLDEGTIALLQKGRGTVEDLLKQQKELGVYSKKDAELAQKYNITMQGLNKTFSMVGGIVASALMPPVIAVMELFTKGGQKLREHRPLVMGFFIALAAIMGVLAIKTAMAFAPFLAIAALIMALATAFAILYDDVQAFLNGQNSLIGELSQKYPKLGEFVREIAAALGMLRDIGAAALQFLADAIDSPSQAMENFRATIDPIIDALCEKFPRLGQFVKDLGNIFSGVFTIASSVFEGIFNLIWSFKDEILGVIDSILSGVGSAVSFVSDAVSTVSGWFGGDDEEKKEAPKPEKEQPKRKKATAWADFDEDGDDVSLSRAASVNANVATGQKALAATSTPLASRDFGSSDTLQSTVSNTNTVEIGKIDVVTQAQDAGGIAGGIGSALENECKSVMQHFDDGVTA